jgi:hypothetical protein
MTSFDIEHVLFWMDAIRNSKDPQRTLESFWKGQIRSKVWLIDNLRKHVNQVVSIDIHGGWNGVLASMLFQSDVFVTNIRNIDIDPECEQVANTVNKIEEMVGKLKHITADMCCIRSDADVIINTSCEHITQEQYDLLLSGMPQNSLLVLQSNNYIIDEHVRPHANLEEFVNTCGLEKILFSGELVLPLYTRYMIIGKK